MLYTLFVMEECPESRDELSQRKSLHPLLLSTLCHVNYALLSLSFPQCRLEDEDEEEEEEVKEEEDP